jgi:hypothetical protein
MPPGGFFRALTLGEKPRLLREKQWNSDSSFKRLKFSKKTTNNHPDEVIRLKGGS